MAKKLDEIKEAISANSTPVKTGMNGGLDHVASDGDLLQDDLSSRRRLSSEYDLWSRFSESRKSSYNNLVPLGENMSSNNNLNQYSTLPENIYQNVSDVSNILNMRLFKFILFS